MAAVVSRIGLSFWSSRRHDARGGSLGKGSSRSQLAAAQPPSADAAAKRGAASDAPAPTAPSVAQKTLLQEPGRALGERLDAVAAASVAGRSHVTLGDLRGSTGAVFEGSLRDASRESASCCVGPLGRPRGEFFAVKGAWMLRFPRNDRRAKSHGVPVPLDGAEVTAAGDNELEISNLHIKEDFLGSKLAGFARCTFVHKVHVCLSAPSREARDAWVAALQAQVQKLAEGQLRKRRAAARPMGRADSEKTTATVAAVGGLAARVFLDFEWEEEFAVLRNRLPSPA